MSGVSADVAIVGAGPIGLELAVALKRAGVDYIHFDARQIGYTISWFPPQTRFFSSNERIAIAGIPLVTADQSKASREEYLAYLRQIALMFELRVNTYERIIAIDRRQAGFQLKTAAREGHRQYSANKLVLCTGGTDHPRRLNIPGEDLPHVDHYFRGAHQYFGTRLLIVGGKNSAVEAALRCHHAGAHVSISYRRDALPQKSIKYWLMPEITALMESGRIESHVGTVPEEITSTHVTLKRSPLSGRARSEGQTIKVPADFVLLLTGYQQDNTLFKLAGVELRGDCGAPVFNEQTMETNVPCLYVAGTATGGTQDKYTVFIENCHVHVDRIVRAITGASTTIEHETPAEVLAQPES
jgi:thioredoxin reductase (NADPH)